MKNRKIKQTQAAKRRKGVVSINLGPRDAAVVMRGAGAVRFVHPRVERIVPGSNGFWMKILHWLFADDEDAAERRQIIVDDFMTDMQERAAEARKKAWREEGATRAREEAVDAGLEEGTDDFQGFVARRTVEIAAELEGEFEAKKHADAMAKKARAAEAKRLSEARVALEAGEVAIDPETETDPYQSKIVDDA